jgi:site-specific recombinase XerD
VAGKRPRFCTRTGTALNPNNVERSFRAITKAAGIGENWTPRELRHSFVSILSDNGVTIQAIADLVGHKTTIVTQKLHGHQFRHVITTVRLPKISSVQIKRHAGTRGGCRRGDRACVRGEGWRQSAR